MISLAGALFAVSTIGGVALAKGGPAAGSNGRGPDPTRVGGRNTTPGVSRGRGPDLSDRGFGGRGPNLNGHAQKGLCNAFAHNSDAGKAHGLPFQSIAGVC